MERQILVVGDGSLRFDSEYDIISSQIQYGIVNDRIKVLVWSQEIGEKICDFWCMVGNSMESW